MALFSVAPRRRPNTSEKPDNPRQNVQYFPRPSCALFRMFRTRSLARYVDRTLRPRDRTQASLINVVVLMPPACRSSNSSLPYSAQEQTHDRQLLSYRLELRACSLSPSCGVWSHILCCSGFCVRAFEPTPGRFSDISFEEGRRHCSGLPGFC